MAMAFLHILISASILILKKMLNFPSLFQVRIYYIFHFTVHQDFHSYNIRLRICCCVTCYTDNTVAGLLFVRVILIFLILNNVFNLCQPSKQFVYEHWLGEKKCALCGPIDICCPKAKMIKIYEKFLYEKGLIC